MLRGTLIDLPSRLRWTKLRGGGRYAAAPWIYLPGYDTRHRFQAVRVKGRRGGGASSWWLLVVDPYLDGKRDYEPPIVIPSLPTLRSTQQAAFSLLQSGDVGFAP